MHERRVEPRIATEAPVVMTPLSAVTTHLHGSVVNLSWRGLKVHASALSDKNLATGNIYRVRSGNDLMLCEIRHRRVEGETADIGFANLHWVSEGDLNRLVKKSPPP